MIIWCMVPEIWSATDKYCHSGPFFFAILPPCGPRKSKFWKNEQQSWKYHFTTVCHMGQSYDIWFLRYKVQQTEFFVILDLKNQNFKKLKKTPRDIIILCMCTINDNYMMYGSWDMKCGGQNFLSFWTVFCLFAL